MTYGWLAWTACREPEPPPPDPPADPPVVFAPEVCPAELGGTPVPTGAACGTVQVPERRGSGSDRTLTLSTLVLPATSGIDLGPVALFNGGPGSSTFGLAALFAESALRADHDLVLFSERGTPGAEPVLDCPELASVDAGFDGSDEALAAARLAAYTQCAARLRADGVDLAAYDNASRAADVPDVLRALGYERWHLWGVSGGAVLVQRVVRDHPDGVATAMADSGAFPVPEMAGVFLGLAENASARFDRMYAECAADPVCGAQYPTFEADLTGLYEALEASPRVVSVTHPTTGETRDVALDGDRLLGLYANHMESVGLLPLVTTLAVAGDFSVIDPLVAELVVADTGPSFADGLYQSVVCADLANHGPEDVRDGGRPELVHALGPAVDHAFDLCDAWDVPARPPGGPVGSDTIPILLMEGRFDTNRDPELADEVAARFHTAVIVEWGDRGHVVYDACADAILAAFVADPTRAPDTSCAPDHVDWTPLF